VKLRTGSVRRVGARAVATTMHFGSLFLVESDSQLIPHGSTFNSTQFSRKEKRP